MGKEKGRRRKKRRRFLDNRGKKGERKGKVRKKERKEEGIKETERKER